MLCYATCFSLRESLICIIPVANARAINILIYSNVCVISNANQQINIFRCVLKAATGLKDAAFSPHFRDHLRSREGGRAARSDEILLFPSAKTHKTHGGERSSKTAKV